MSPRSVFYCTARYLALCGLLMTIVAANPCLGQESTKDQEASPEATKAKETPKTTPITLSSAEIAKAEELFESGRKLFFQADYLGAAAKLTLAVDANPTKTSYKLLLAKAHHYARQDAKAIELLEDLMKTSPDHVEAGIELATLLKPNKHPDRVIAILQPLLKFKHDYPLYHLLAEAYYQKEQLDKARQHFEEAVKLNPRSGPDYYQLGNIYLAEKRFAKAATAYEAAGNLGLSTGVYHFKMASVYFNLHNYLGTVSVVEVLGGKVGQIKNQRFLVDPVPGKKDTFYGVGPRSALYHAVKAQQMGVDVFDLTFLEANIWLSARRYANADKIYAKLVDKVRKEDAGLYWFSRAQAALGLDDFDGYLQRLEKAIAAEPEVYKPTQADAYVTVALRYQQAGSSEKHLQFLGKAVATNPLSARLHLILGDAYWQASKGDKAIEQYRLVLELEPDHAQRVSLLNRIRGEEIVPDAATGADG